MITVLTRSVCFVLVLISIVVPFGYADAQAQLERVTLGYPATAMSHFPAFVGREFGQFRDEGLDVQLVRVSGNVVVAALLAGELGYTTSADATVRSPVLGLPIKMLAAIGVKPSLSLIVRPEIKTVADLKGKAIAISTPGTTTDFTAREIVKHYGLNPDRDITTVGLGDQPQRMAACKAALSRAPLSLRRTISKQRPWAFVCWSLAATSWRTVFLESWVRANGASRSARTKSKKWCARW